MAEDQDFIEEAIAEGKLRFGRELSPDEMATELARHGFDDRIHHLKRLKDPDAMTVEEAAKRYDYKRALKRKHEILTKVGR